MRRPILTGLILIIFLSGDILISAPKHRKIKQTESQKMTNEIDRIQKRVSEIRKNTDTYKLNKEKLNELEMKLEKTKSDLNYW
ncbi:MAG: rRNA-processing protein Efg1 [Fusobacteriales bacterium]|jgi:uncharacterized membrane protein (DUF106 family)|nr:rRNA-processing protein Efg1 [Fusobacteriales bacterium]